MIGSLKGIVSAVGEDRAIIEVQGVGYLIFAGARTLSRMPPGAAVHVFVETQLREDSLKLFGFLSDQERAWFARLQEISGVGAKVALAILDTLSPHDLMEAAALEDRTSVARANGVGPKLAARIVTELKGRASPPSLMGTSATGSSLGGAFTPPDSSGDTAPEARREGLSDMTLRNQAISALANLGVGQPDALRAVASAYRSFEADPSLGELVKAALKELGR